MSHSPIVRKLKSQKGMLTIDFVFAMTLAFGISAIFFTVTFALSVVEVVQYMTYSTSRSFYAAHLNRDQQVELGNAKFAELRANPAVNNLFENEWFELGNPQIDDHHDLYGYSDQLENDAPIFTGVRIPIQLNVLAIRWPFLGQTGEASEFTAHTTAFIGREPTFEECKEFNSARLNAILSLDGRFGSTNASNYAEMTDNGC